MVMSTEPQAPAVNEREASAAGLMVGILLLSFLGMLVFVIFAFV